MPLVLNRKQTIPLNGQRIIWDLSEDSDRLVSSIPLPGSAVGMTNAESGGNTKCCPFKSCAECMQDNTVKIQTIYFFKTLLAVVLPRNRIFLIQTKIITILIPSRANSQLVPYLLPQLSRKNCKDINKRYFFFFFNLNSFFLLNFLFCIVLAN